MNLETGVGWTATINLDSDFVPGPSETHESKLK